MTRRPTTGSDGPPVAAPGAGTTRRDLFKTAALLGGCAAAARVGWAIGPGRPDFRGAETIYRPDYPLEDPENVVTTTCLGCHGGCPVRATREVGAVVKIDGNPWVPRLQGGALPADLQDAARMRGASCARGQARLQNTHDPFRIVRPLARVGERGGAAWRTLEEAQAASMLAEAGLDRLAAGQLVVAVDPRQADRQAALVSFLRAVPNASVQLGHPAPWLVEATEAVVGEPGWICLPRWDRATAVLMWGADAFASGFDPVGDSRALVAERSPFHRRPLIVVDPRLSISAGKADLWLPVRPGGDQALSWMILKAWAESARIDAPEEWLRPVAVHSWSDLEHRAGLGREVVHRAADLLADAGPGLAVRVGGGVGERAGGASATESVLRLAISQGAAAAGGAMEPTWLPTVLGERPADALARRLVRDEGHIDLLVVVGDGGISEAPDQRALLAALADRERVGMLVVVATVNNPVAALADLVLPDVSDHERSGVVVRTDGVSLVRPVIPSILAETGLSEPWSRGLEGVLEHMADTTGAKLDCQAAVEHAIANMSEREELLERGWVPPKPFDRPAPLVDRLGAGPVLDTPPLGEGLPLVPYREPFGGFVDSGAQYWVTPSLRLENEAWMHPETAEALGLTEGDRVRLAVEGAEHPEAGHETLLKATPGIRPEAVALALGYGHHEGFDGHTLIDGEALVADPRRTRGVDAASLWRLGAGLSVESEGPPPSPTLAEALAGPLGTCNRT